MIYVKTSDSFVKTLLFARTRVCWSWRNKWKGKNTLERLGLTLKGDGLPIKEEELLVRKGETLGDVGGDTRLSFVRISIFFCLDSSMVVGNGVN